MPIVPIRSNSPRQSAIAAQMKRPPPPEPWALMAAAQMHSEGRLVEPTSEVPDGGK